MSFIRQAFAAFVLVTLTIGLQSAGMAALAEWARTHVDKGADPYRMVRAAHLLVRMASLLICLHMLEILLWAAFYRWRCLGSWESAFYFSAASYSTVGYGDVLLPMEWRATGPIESISGVLMCGLSASLLFAVMTRLVERRTDTDQRLT